jgi:biotin carboxyl carrier protein
MPGLITSVAVSAGDRVEEGDVVAVLEAMKTQNEVRSTRRGTVAEVYVEEGAVVAAGDAILRVEG